MRTIGGYEIRYPQWLEHKSVDEISIVSLIALLKSWGDFDTQNGQPE
jgi:hypothetical protein